MRVMAEAVEPRARVYIYAHRNEVWENRDKTRRRHAALLQDQSSGFWLAPRTGPRCTGRGGFCRSVRALICMGREEGRGREPEENQGLC